MQHNAAIVPVSHAFPGAMNHDAPRGCDDAGADFQTLCDRSGHRKGFGRLRAHNLKAVQRFLAGREPRKRVRSDLGCFPGAAINKLLPWSEGESLPRLPHAWNQTLPPYLKTLPKQCGMLIDRHVHKNGGSTVRDLFLENERHGYALYEGYSQMNWRHESRWLRKRLIEALEVGKVSGHHAPTRSDARPRNGSSTYFLVADVSWSLRPAPTYVAGSERTLSDGGPFWMA